MRVAFSCWSNTFTLAHPPKCSAALAMVWRLLSSVEDDRPNGCVFFRFSRSWERFNEVFRGGTFLSLSPCSYYILMKSSKPEISEERRGGLIDFMCTRARQKLFCPGRLLSKWVGSKPLTWRVKAFSRAPEEDTILSPHARARLRNTLPVHAEQRRESNMVKPPRLRHFDALETKQYLGVQCRLRTGRVQCAPVMHTVAHQCEVRAEISLWVTSDKSSVKHVHRRIERHPGISWVCCQCVAWNKHTKRRTSAPQNCTLVLCNGMTEGCGLQHRLDYFMGFTIGWSGNYLRRRRSAS